MVSKGANAVVSYLHYYFSRYSFGERSMHLHANNCVGQNKNNIVCWYLAYRIMQNLNHDIVLSFLPVGHTKFGPDYAFGIFKKSYNKSEAHTLNDVVNIIESSTTNSHLNFAELTGDEQGFIFINVNDWKGYFESKGAKILPGITKFGHFHFSREWPGEVKFQHESDSTLFSFQFFDPKTSFTDEPEILEPEGLSAARQQYLYDKIRPFCREYAKDIVCPKPPDKLLSQESRKTEPSGPPENEKPKRRTAKKKN